MTTARLAATIDRTLDLGYDACPTVVDPEIREYIFAFDGGGGYAPYNRLFHFKDPLTLKSGWDFFWDDQAEGYERDGNGKMTRPPRTWDAAKFALYQRVNELDYQEEGNAALIDALGDAVGELERPVPKRVMYYPWNASGIAANCARKIVRLYREAGRPVAISSIGFSLGGYANILFNRMLNWAGIRLKNVLTLDPVPFTHEIVRALFVPKNGTVISVPGNHDSWLNLFQRLDSGTLDTGPLRSVLGDLPIHGAKLSGNVRNRIPLDSENQPIDHHMGIPYCDVAEAEMLRILRD